jgi:Xaa-Pro aminopeptidase
MNTLLYSGFYDMNTEKYPFEVDPNFFYLTSCDLPNVLVLNIGKKLYVCIELLDNKWYDTSYFMTALQHCFRAEIIQFKDILKLLHKQKDIHTLPNIVTHPQWNQLKRLTMDMSSIPTKLSKKREIKFIDEQTNITTACKYTSEAIKHILKNSYPGMSQIELVGLFKQCISKHGIQELSFNPITSHGKYNQYLHYIAKDRPVTKGSLVLLDLGCKHNHYCSDISRCFPISGKFTQLQKDIYTIVLKALTYALTLMKPGKHWNDITHKVLLKLYDECLTIQLVKLVTSDESKIQLMKLFMPHSLGHHVGLDNHDCGPISVLKKDMVVAVEPGIYFQSKVTSPHINMTVWKKYEHLGGVRLEDTIIITDKGHRNLSKITKTINGIEKLMDTII